MMIRTARYQVNSFAFTLPSKVVGGSSNLVGFVIAWVLGMQLINKIVCDR